MSKKINLILTLLVIVGMLAAFIPASAQDSDVIKIGIVDSMTGGHAAYGLASLDGYKLAHKYRDTALGKKIEFIIVDTKKR